MAKRVGLEHVLYCSFLYSTWSSWGSQQLDLIQALYIYVFPKHQSELFEVNMCGRRICIPLYSALILCPRVTNYNPILIPHFLSIL
jgi:hypothetical protein